jgi:hypothetical protein
MATDRLTTPTDHLRTPTGHVRSREREPIGANDHLFTARVDLVGR